MSEPIRVLNVVGRMDRGGIETLIMNIYRNIDRSKIQFDFLAHYGKVDADYNEEIRALGGRIYEMPVIKSTTKTYYWRFFKYIKALKKFFKDHPEYHVVHGHMTNIAAIYMPIAKKYGRVTTCIAHSHLSKTQKSVSKIASLGTDVLRSPIRKYATDYFACSESAALWIFKQEDIDAGKVKIINNGIDSAKFKYSVEKRKAVRKGNCISDDMVVIGHVGRFFDPKNHRFIIDIFEKYHAKNPNSILMLIGDGELRKEIEEKVHSKGLGAYVKFMGLRGDVAELMQAMDLFLMPSLYEGLPVVGIEAQASSLPLLVSTGITKELDVTGNVTFMELSDEAQKWSEKIGEILQSYNRHNDSAEKIATAGYDIHKTVEFLEKFYVEHHNQKRGKL